MFMYVLVLISLSAYVHAERKAVAVLTVGTANGTIYFSDIGRGILITGSVSGLTPGNHGFHIHDKGDLSNGCTSTGSHFNPHHMNHGAPIDSVRHVGDLGNIIADQQGVAQINFSDKVIHLEGVNNILGRAVVVHADADDLGKGGHEDSLTTGHAGARVGCGVIGIVNESNSGDNQKVLSLATVFTSGLFLIIRNFVH